MSAPTLYVIPLSEGDAERLAAFRPSSEAPKHYFGNLTQATPGIHEATNFVRQLLVEKGLSAPIVGADEELISSVSLRLRGILPQIQDTLARAEHAARWLRSHSQLISRKLCAQRWHVTSSYLTTRVQPGHFSCSPAADAGAGAARVGIQNFPVGNLDLMALVPDSRTRSAIWARAPGNGSPTSPVGHPKASASSNFTLGPFPSAVNLVLR